MYEEPSFTYARGIACNAIRRTACFVKLESTVLSRQPHQPLRLVGIVFLAYISSIILLDMATQVAYLQTPWLQLELYCTWLARWRGVCNSAMDCHGVIKIVLSIDITNALLLVLPCCSVTHMHACCDHSPLRFGARTFPCNDDDIRSTP